MKSKKRSKKQADTLITPEKVKTFILNNIVFIKDRYIQGQIEYTRNIGILNFLIGMTFFYFINAQELFEGIGKIFFAIYFYSTILLSIFIGFLAVKIKKKAISNINNIFDGKKVPNRKEVVWLGLAGGGIGAVFGPRLNLSGNTLAFLGIIVGSSLLLMSAFLISSAQYELYLLKKYCPEISYLQAEDIIPKKTTIPKNKKRK